MNVHVCVADVPSASKVKKMHATLCFDVVFFQCCVQLFKSCVHFSKVACTFLKLRATFQKLRALFKSYAQLSKVACTFQKLRATFQKSIFKSCVQLFKSQFSKVACALLKSCEQLSKVERNF